MSKAFTREDDAPETPIAARRVSALPPGTQNLMTPDGVQKLRTELAEVRTAYEQLRATRGDPDKPQKLAALEQRAMFLDGCLRTASVVQPPATPDDRVRFGATVTVREPDGTMARHRIVGVDEVDFDRGWVSWLSPIARSLLKKSVGQRVRLRLPGGEKDLEITGVAYE
ncbi:MAG: transcription elongation factor GreAB [Proteobacteria bacterium]|nr:transcription elongation factor GreAB [Pseudomonadota bacterium]